MSTATAPADALETAPASTERRHAGHAEVAVVIAPALLALGLCLYGLGSRSLGFDEAASVAIASRHGSALAHAIARDGGNMSAYYALLHAVMTVFGDGLWAIRTPSAVATAVTVALTALLALRWFDRRVALIAGVFAAVSLPLVFWAQSARGYAPMVALTTGSFVALDAMLAGRRRARLAYIACTALAIYCGFVAVLVIPAQLLLLARRDRAAVRRTGTALAVVALCCSPLVVLAATRGSGQLFWVPRPSPGLDGQVIDSIASAGLAPSFPATATTTALLILTAVVLLGLASTRPRRGAPLFAWLLVPVVLAWLESIVGQPVFIERNLLTVLPAVAILLAVAVTHHRLPRVAAGALLVGLVALRTLQVTAAYGVSPEDWRSATASVLGRAAPGDCIAFYPADGHMAFSYYARGVALAPRSILPAAPLTDPPRPFVEDYASLPGRTIRGLPARCPRLWLVSSHQGQADGPARSRANLTRFARLQAALERRYLTAGTTTFGYAATITVELLGRPAVRASASSPRTSGS